MTDTPLTFDAVDWGDQPSYTGRIASARTAVKAGLVRSGNVLSLKAAKHWGGASFDAIHPSCPRCERAAPAPHVNPFFTDLWHFANGLDPKAAKTPLYSQFVTCEDCLQVIDSENDKAKWARRMQELADCGFTTVQRQWSFDTYPNQGSPWLKRAKQYVANPVSDIVIFGNPGVYKTGLAVTILRSLWNDRKHVMMIRASELMLLLRGVDAPKVQETMRRMVDVEYLCIDDLSALKHTEFYEDIMSMVVDMRQQDQRPTLFTANIRISGRDDPTAVLTEFFGYVVYDRLRERGEFWHVTGQSGRAPAAAKPRGQSDWEREHR